MPDNHDSKLPKTLYMLWLQGWADTPEVVTQCRRSWEHHNPTWNIVLLDQGNLSNHLDAHDFDGLPDLPPASLSDVVRVHLLKRGGIWVDATCFCCMPLDDWIHEHMSSGFFAFDRPGNDRMISSWFMAAVPGSSLVDIYCRATQRYWRRNPALRPVEQVSRVERVLARPKVRRLMTNRSWLWHSFLVKKVLRVYSYYWFHFLFGHCYRRNRRFRAVWDATPKVSALIPHRLLHHGLSKPLGALKLEISRRFSPLYKLRWRSEGDLHPDCAIKFLPQTLRARNRREQEPIEHYVTRSDKNRIIYLINPKCACTSLKAFVVTNDDQINIDTTKIGKDGAFAGIDKTEDITPYRGYFKFSFVRNPWDRLVSCYTEKVLDQGRWADIFGAEPSFQHFVRTVASIPDEDADIHWRSQHVNLVDRDNKVVVDFLGRVEEIEDGVHYIAARTGLKCKLGHYRKSNHRPYTSYYDDETRQLVAQRFAVDIAMFGYQFGWEVSQAMHYQTARLLRRSGQRPTRTLSPVRTRHIRSLFESEPKR